MKYENTRIVTFKEDYYVKTPKDHEGNFGRRILHKKGSRHAMHKGIVKVLESNGAKISVEMLDFKKIEQARKEKLQRQDEVKMK